MADLQHIISKRIERSPTGGRRDTYCESCLRKSRLVSIT